jgi:serine/threonine protein kinase
MISYDRLIDLTKIGRGEFGEVLVGAMSEFDVPASSIKKHQHQNENGTTDENEIQPQQKVQVLVKSLSKIKDESFFVEFRRQIDLYRAVDSKNVVKLLALSFEKDHHFMVLEQSRDLKGYLVDHPDTSSQQLISFSRQIACGLDAIAKSKLTHR